MAERQILDQISIVCANFGNGAIFRDVLNDWFKFLGGRPGEVVVVDGGSDKVTQAVYWELYQEGLIDKLQLISSNHPENRKDLCFVQEHTAGAIASKKYLLWFKVDTLPYRQGHDNWLKEAIGYLDRDDTFAIGGSFNEPVKHHEAWPGWYFTHKCSENFSLMKRDNFIAAMEEFAGDYIASGFRGESPAAKTRQARYLVEVAFEQYIQRHQKYTLVKVEDPTWTVFHTNVTGDRLIKTRENYLARKNVKKYMNAGTMVKIHGGCYYGKPRRPLTELRVALGATIIGSYWRTLKRWLGIGKVAQ